MSQPSPLASSPLAERYSGDWWDPAPARPATVTRPYGDFAPVTLRAADVDRAWRALRSAATLLRLEAKDHTRSGFQSGATMASRYAAECDAAAGLLEGEA